MINEKYLGLPLFLGRSKKQIFQSNKERLEKIIRGWRNNFLSPARKSVLIQSVTQIFPLHHMYCYKLPKDFLHELNMNLARL